MTFDASIAAHQALQRLQASGELGEHLGAVLDAESVFSQSVDDAAFAAYETLQAFGDRYSEPRLRHFAREGAAEELDLDGTIDGTARRGWLDVHMRPERHNAFKLLRARLYDFELAKREAKAAEDAKARLKIEWGSQIRSYVLFPYQQVADHRTEVKTSNVDGILDGDLDGLIRTYLLSQGGKS